MYVRTKIYGAINAKAMSTRFSLYRYYLGLHYWLRAYCDRLSPRTRRRLVYGISVLYLACSLVMIAQVFFPRKVHSNLLSPGISIWMFLSARLGRIASGVPSRELLIN